LPHALSCQSQQDCQALGDSLFCEHIPSLGSSVCTGLYEHEPRLYPALFDRKTHRAGAPVTLVSTGRKPLTLFGILFEKTRKPVTFVKTPSLETLRFPIVLQPKEKREWAVDHAGGSSPGTLVLVESDGVNVPRSALRVMGGFHGCVLKYRGVGTVEAFTSRAKRIELRNAGDKACNIKKIYWKDGSSPAYSFSVPKESSWWLFPDNHVSLFFIDIAYDRAKDAQDRYQTTKLVIESNSLAEPKVEIYLEAIGR
jgi:hypothetical protein